MQTKDWQPPKLSCTGRSKGKGRLRPSQWRSQGGGHRGYVPPPPIACWGPIGPAF